ncbi:collagenase-like [Battus philenor]|uniref:collagenase-like n=1 Tax=Battus philenor TaxID=42288 RepID=UPI0035CF85F6
MKLFLLALFCLLTFAAAVEPIQLYYHESAGIAEAESIRAAELAADFDGSRIVGGSAASLGQYPYMCGLVIRLNSGATSVCGSSLLSNTRLVTAAHCWWDGRNQARQFTVVCGSIRLFSGGTRINTNRVQMHGSYSHSTLRNDIAIISTNNINYNNNIGRIQLASGSNNFAGSWAHASGFGRQRDSAGITNNQVKHHVRLQVITNAVCRNTFGSAIVDSTLCTSGAGNVGTCSGDSGGPLVTNNHLIGVTSFVAAAGCQRGMPAGFARVTSFESWIRGRL